MHAETTPDPPPETRDSTTETPDSTPESSHATQESSHSTQESSHSTQESSHSTQESSHSTSGSSSSTPLQPGAELDLDSRFDSQLDSELAAQLNPLESGTSPASVDRSDPRRRLLIGRSSRCHVIVDSPLVSRRHCELIRTRSGFLLQDLGSRNGTWVAGERRQTAVLHAGDQFRVADISVRVGANGKAVVTHVSPDGIAVSGSAAAASRVAP